MDDTEMESDTDTEDCIPENQVYIPGTDAEPDGGLECDFSAYVMYHNGRTGISLNELIALSVF